MVELIRPSQRFSTKEGDFSMFVIPNGAPNSAEYRVLRGDQEYLSVEVYGSYNFFLMRWQRTVPFSTFMLAMEDFFAQVTQDPYRLDVTVSRGDLAQTFLCDGPVQDEDLFGVELLPQADKVSIASPFGEFAYSKADDAIYYSGHPPSQPVKDALSQFVAATYPTLPATASAQLFDSLTIPTVTPPSL